MQHTSLETVIDFATNIALEPDLSGDLMQLARFVWLVYPGTEIELVGDADSTKFACVQWLRNDTKFTVFMSRIESTRTVFKLLLDRRVVESQSIVDSGLLREARIVALIRFLQSIALRETDFKLSICLSYS